MSNTYTLRDITSSRTLGTVEANTERGARIKGTRMHNLPYAWVSATPIPVVAPVQDHTAHNAGYAHNLIECTHPECASYTAPAVQAPATVPAPPIYPLAFILDCLVGDGFDSTESEWNFDHFPLAYAMWEKGRWGGVDRYGYYR